MLTAANLLDASHPLHKAFAAYCQGKGVEPSKRQARQFLKKYPQYGEVRQG
jgi:hypothetical protein